MNNNSNRFQEMANAIDSFERSKNDIKSIVYFKVKDTIHNTFKEFNSNKVNQDNIERIKNELVLKKGIGNFKIGESDYLNSLIEIIEKPESFIEYSLVDCFFDQWDEFLLLNDMIEAEELVRKVLLNQYYLRFKFLDYLLRYIAFYNFCPYDQLIKYFESLSYKRLKEHFYYSCKSNNGLLIFETKEMDTFIYKLFLKASTFYDAEVHPDDSKYLRLYLKYDGYDKYPDTIPVIDSILNKVSNYEKIIKTKNFKLEFNKISENQLKIVENNIVGRLLDESTTIEQLRAFFSADFKYLKKNKLIINSKYTFAIFRYFIDEIKKENFYYVDMIFNTLDIYRWLYHNGVYVTTKQLRQARSDNEKPRYSEDVDDLIKKLKNSK